MHISSTPAGRWNQVWVLFLAAGFIYFGRWFLLSERWLPLLLVWAALFVVEHLWWNRHTFRTVFQAVIEHENSNRRLSPLWLVNLIIDLPVAFVTFAGSFIVLETTIVGSILAKHLSYMWFNPYPEFVQFITVTVILGNVLLFILSNVTSPEDGTNSLQR